MQKKQSVTRRQFLRLTSAVGATAFLAACAAPAAPAASGDGDGEAMAEMISLRYQSREPERAAGIAQLWKEFYPQFQEANPNIEVEFLPDPGGANRREGALSAMVAGNAPDLTEWCCSSSTFFMQKGETVSLQPYIDRDAEEVNLDDYYDKQFDPWTLDGDIHLMPRFTGTQGIYFNKDMFDAKGIDYPPQEWGAWNWEDYTNLLRQFADADAQPQLWGTSNYGLNANWLSQYWIRGFGANMVDPEDNTHCGLDSTEAYEALEWMRSIIHDEPLFAYGADIGMGVVELFLGQRTALMEIGPWNLGVQADGATFRWDVAPMPDGPAGPNHASVGGWHYGLEGNGTPGRILGTHEMADESDVRAFVHHMGAETAFTQKPAAGVCADNARCQREVRGSSTWMYSPTPLARTLADPKRCSPRI